MTFRERNLNVSTSRRLAAAALVGAALFAVAPAAHASVASVTGSRLVLTSAAPAHEVNLVTIAPSGGGYAITDTRSPVAAGAGCTSVALGQVTCSDPKIALIVIDTGDLNDTITNSTSIPSRISGGSGNDHINGGAGNDTLAGNSGVDTINGHAGDDTITTRGHVADVVTRGAGNDTATVDRVDGVAPDCETVIGPPAPPPTAGPSGDTTAAAIDAGAPGGSPVAPAGVDVPAVTTCIPARIATGATLFGSERSGERRGGEGGWSWWGPGQEVIIQCKRF